MGKIFRKGLTKRLQHRCFPVKFAKLLGTPILKNICKRLLLFVVKSYCFVFLQEVIIVAMILNIYNVVWLILWVLYYVLLYDYYTICCLCSITKSCKDLFCDSIGGVFLWILRNFFEQFFYKTTLCFCNFTFHEELFIWEKLSHPGETSHMSEISAEWCISLCKNKSFIRERTHPTQVRSHLTASEISLRWDNFSPCQQFLPGCPT